MAVALWGLARLSTGFLPLEDQGYLIVAGSFRMALRWNAPAGDGRGRRRSPKCRGSNQVLAIAGISVLDGSASLANAGVDYVVLKPWSEARRRARALGRLYA